MIKKKIVIIGAGPCGLGAAFRLDELGFEDFVVLEKEDFVGGLARSFVDKKGFTWDVGGHVVHSHYDYFDKVFFKVLKDKYLEHQRESWIWLLDRFVPYPFQNNLHRLPREVQWECVQGLLEVALGGERHEVKNFKEWILAVFGKGIAKYFLFPYNFKVWAYPIEKMNRDWVGDRVSVVNVEKTIQNTLLKKDDISWGPNNVFQYPLKGGTGYIWQSVAGLLSEGKIEKKVEAVEIDVKKKQLKTKDGREYTFKHLISTMPLTTLCKKARLSQTNLAEKHLHYSTVHVIGLGFGGKVPGNLKTKCWMYFPEDNSPFYRVTVFSNYSPGNVAISKKQWSLMFEVAQSKYKPVNKDGLVDEVIKGALATKLITKEDKIVSKWHHVAPFGYPTPTLNRDKAVNKLLPLLEKYSVYSRGRFGAWKYEVSNQDHSFMQGVEVVDRILKKKKEVTVWEPNKVNRKKQVNR